MPSAPRVLAIAALLTVLAPLASVRDLQPLSTPSAIAPPAALVRALAAESRALQPGATDAAGLAARLVSAATTLSLHLRATSPPGAWAPAVAALASGGAAHAVVAGALVTDLYERLHARPDWRETARTGGIAPHTASAFAVDYPGAIAAPSPNYWWARRPSRTSIRYVVIHDTEAPCASALAWLTNRLSEASAHFIVCRDGRIYQLVRVTDAAWHAGNTYINYHSIGIEHEGYAGGPYTPAQYAATADLLRWLNVHLHLQLQWTRNAVIGHENVPAADHVDPGTGWDWPRFMSLLTGGAPYLGGDANTAIVLVRRAYVRACPSISCALLGTADWGEQFHVLARAAGWVKIDYAGAPSWVIGVVLGKGLGTAVHIVAKQATAVHAWPSAGSVTIGHLAIGQTYISTLIDDALDRKGWWFLEYADRYGYVCACGTRPSFNPAPPPRPNHTPRPTAAPTLPALPLSIPSPPATATRTPAATHTPRTTRTARPSATGAVRPTGTPISSPTAMLTPTPTATPMPTDSSTATVSAGASATAVATPAIDTPTAVATPATGTPTAVDAPTVTGTDTATETPTETATPVPTDTPSPTVAPTSTSIADLCRGRIC